jgi:hypothetical protein
MKQLSVGGKITSSLELKVLSYITFTGRVAAKIELSLDETDELNRLIKSGKTEQRKVERAKIDLRSAEGKPTHQLLRNSGRDRPERASGLTVSLS